MIKEQDRESLNYKQTEKEIEFSFKLTGRDREGVRTEINKRQRGINRRTDGKINSQIYRRKQNK